MIIDAHTHVFPPRVIERRDDLLATEPAFAEIYGNPDAKMATADELLASMDEAGIDRSIVCNFAWHSEVLVEATNDYLLEWGQRSGGRIAAVRLDVLSAGTSGRTAAARWRRRRAGGQARRPRADPRSGVGGRARHRRAAARAAAATASPTATRPT